MADILDITDRFWSDIPKLKLSNGNGQFAVTVHNCFYCSLSSGLVLAIAYHVITHAQAFRVGYQYRGFDPRLGPTIK